MALYATFDYSPWASHCAMSKALCPYFQGGLPLSRAVFHLPYAGFAIPLPTSKFLQASLYGGVGFMKQTKLVDLLVGSTVTQTQFNGAQRTDWAKKPIYGVEVPVSSIIDKVKSGIGGSASSSKKGAGS